MQDNLGARYSYSLLKTLHREMLSNANLQSNGAQYLRLTTVSGGGREHSYRSYDP